MATKDKQAKGMTQADFDKTLKNISGLAESLAVDVHKAGIYCLQQANIHNNADAGQRLIEAIGKKQDKQRVGRWLVFFGKFTVKNDLLVYKKRKDITPANVEGWLQRADEMPYWDLTAQPKLMITYDYLSMVKSIITKASHIPDLEENGKTVTVKNEGVLKELGKIIEAFEKTDKLPEVKKEIVKATAKRGTKETEPAHVGHH